MQGAVLKILKSGALSIAKLASTATILVASISSLSLSAAVPAAFSSVMNYVMCLTANSSVMNVMRIVSY